eukprot:844281-Pyramimonas_sp.AAC.1
MCFTACVAHAGEHSGPGGTFQDAPRAHLPRQARGPVPKKPRATPGTAFRRARKPISPAPSLPLFSLIIPLPLLLPAASRVCWFQWPEFAV